MNSRDHELARLGLLGQEESYSEDWAQDAERLGKSGLYNAITQLVNPQSDEVIVDIGTGTGLQLVSLASKARDAITIGTERTRANVMHAYQYLSGLGLKNALSALSSSELAVTADEKHLYWRQQIREIADCMEQVRRELSLKILILEDNILMPELLTHVLENRPLDAGILSMPGGSASRLLEWPYDMMSTLTEAKKRERAKDITDQTRYAFYHFMSEHVRPGGRIVVAERMLTDPELSPQLGAQMAMAKHMGGLTNYWEATKGILLDAEFSNTSVQLHARNSRHTHISGANAEEHGYQSHIAIIRFDRNNTAFNEPPLPHPEGSRV